jgi:uncharacterized protein (TIGR03437 family)
MITRWRRFARLATVLAVVPFTLLARRNGPPPGRTGAPGETTCWTAGCHLSSTGAFIPNSTALKVNFGGGTSYTPGGPKQQWTVTVDDPAAVVCGFQLTARVEASNAQAGVFNAIVGGDPVIVVPSGFFEYVEHTRPKTPGSFTFEWTPPSSPVGNIRIYLAANAANGNDLPSGDRIHTASFLLPPVATDGKPVITPGQVVNVWSGQPVLADAAWISIKGTNLSPATRIWRPEEIVGGQLPKSLDGVSVRVNNSDAFVYYISPTQINVQAPTDAAAGPVPVQVTAPGGTSDPVMVTKQQTAPAMLVWGLGVATEPNRYVGALATQTQPGGSTAIVYLGKTGLLRPVGLATRPAKPGETVTLYATGYGPTNPPTVAGQVIGTPAPTLASPVTVRIGGQPATLAGNTGYVIFAGQCQFNVAIPSNLPDGDYQVELDIGGRAAQSDMFITVQR